MPRRTNEVFDLDDLMAGLNLGRLAEQLPPGITPENLLRALLEYEDTAMSLDEEQIKMLCSRKALEQGKKLVAARLLTQRSFDGEVVEGTIVDGGEEYHPSFDFNLSSFGCDCPEPGNYTGCSHIAALMWAWSQDPSAFLPAHPSPAEAARLMNSPFGAYLQSVTGKQSYAQALEAFKLMRTKGDGDTAPETAAPRLGAGVADGMPNTSTGAAHWPLATSMRVSSPPLHETLEAEFNTAQLRELAKWLNVKLKGTAKSGFVEQVAAALNERAARMRENPDVLLEDLPEDYAAFVRRALTARDHELPLPRNLANTLWTQQANRDPDKRLTDLLETLRRRAVLFPTRTYFGYRDVYYQWRPLNASGGNVPVVTWPAAMVVSKSKPKQIAPASNFLDAFDLLVNAVLSTGTEVRPSLTPHPKTASTVWLKDWEHDAEEAERLLNSRPGWVPNPQSGISIPLLSPLTADALARLENQTGLPGAQCEFLFGLACALQLIEAPDPLAAASPLKGAFKPLASAWRVNARASAVEEWFALSNEDKFLRAWNAWRERLFFGVEARRAAESHFQIMRAIGAREFTPSDLAAEWCALRRYVARALRGLPAGEWINWAEFRRQLFDLYPEAAWALFSPDHWWFSPPGKALKLNPAQYDDWQRTVGAVIRTIVAESLKWFGVVEVEVAERDSKGAEDGKALHTFRLTDIHTWLNQVQPLTSLTEPAALPPLPDAAVPRQRQAEPVAWLSDRQWRLPPAPDRAEFITFARRIGAPGDAPFTYTLTPESIERALSNGIGVEEVAAQFEQFGAPMPVAARALFQSIADRFGRVRVYASLTLLQLADDYALRELLANTSLAQHIVYQISPRAVVVRDEAVDALVEEMVARGYTPGVK